MISRTPYCFRSSQRLHRPQEFTRVFSARKMFRGERGTGFVLHFCSHEDAIFPRMGIVVPKKLVKRATERNAIKRQGREAFRLMAASLPRGDLVLRVIAPLGELGDGKGHPIQKSLLHRGWRMQINALFDQLVSS